MADTTTATPEALGLRVKAERKRLSLTQLSLCEATRVSHGTLSMYESGQRYPSLEFLLKFETLGADLGFVLHGTYAETPDAALERQHREQRLVALCAEETVVINQLLTLTDKLKRLRAEIGTLQVKLRAER